MRRVVIAVVVVVAVVSAVVFGARAWLGSDDPRARLERALAQTLHRDVIIEGLEVDGSRVALTGVTIGNPEGIAGAPLLIAPRIDLEVALEDLLDDEVSGVVRAEAVDLRIVKQNGVTNLLGPLKRGTGEHPLDLHVDLAIVASRLLLEDLDRGQSLALEGVGVRALLSNRDGSRTADATVTVDEVGLHGIPLRDVELHAKATDDRVEIDRLDGTLGRAGKVHGTGELFLQGERGWSFVVSASDVDLDGDVRPLVAALYPPLTATADATAAQGKLAADVELSGTGLHWEEIRPTLQGRGTLTLTDVTLPERSLLLDLAALAGRAPGPFTLSRGTVDAKVGSGWVELVRVTADTDAIPVPVTGRVSLQGELDLRVDLLPLVRVFGVGPYREVGKVAASIPVRVRGTVEHPEIAPPTASDVSRSLVGGALRRALADDD